MLNNNSYNQNQMNNSNPIVTLSHETGIILSKQSSESDIKRYFNKSVRVIQKRMTNFQLIWKKYIC